MSGFEKALGTVPAADAKAATGHDTKREAVTYGAEVDKAIQARAKKRAVKE